MTIKNVSQTRHYKLSTLKELKRVIFNVAESSLKDGEHESPGVFPGSPGPFEDGASTRDPAPFNGHVDESQPQLCVRRLCLKFSPTCSHTIQPPSGVHPARGRSICWRSWNWLQQVRLSNTATGKQQASRHSCTCLFQGSQSKANNTSASIH